MITNPVELNHDQMEFMFTHYVEYAANPIPLMFWLFETACFMEEQEQMIKESVDSEDQSDSDDWSDEDLSIPFSLKQSKKKGKRFQEK